MVPHALFVSSDRHVDVALNLLTVLVSAALLANVAYLLFMWLRPLPVMADRGDVGPPAWASMSPFLSAPRFDIELPLPHGFTIYRCEHRGVVTYSDRPCPTGGVRALSLRPF